MALNSSLARDNQVNVSSVIARIEKHEKIPLNPKTTSKVRLCASKSNDSQSGSLSCQ